MRTIAFTSFAQKYAQAMGQKGVPVLVTFNGTTAWTNNKRINLPALPYGTMLTPWEAKVLTGYLDHEIGHLRHTDFSVVKMPINTFSPSYKKDILIHGLFNIFEDIREENAYIQEYPPVQSYLDACTQQIEYDYQMKTTPDKGVQQALAAIYREAYEKYRKANVIWNFKMTIDQISELALVQEAMKELSWINSTRAARSLAEKVYDLLPKEDSSDSDGPEQKQGVRFLVKGGSDAEDQKSDDAEDQKSDDESKSSDSKSDELKSEDKKSKESQKLRDVEDGTIEDEDQKSEDGDAEAQKSEAAEPFKNEDVKLLEQFFEGADKSAAIKEFLEQIVEENLPKIKEELKKKQRNKYETAGSEILPPAGRDKDEILIRQPKNKIQYDYCRNSLLPQITAMKKMLNIALRARTKRAWERGLSEGQLDELALPNLFSGDLNLFKERRVTYLVDTAVQMVVDQSGSMTIDNMMRAAIMTAESMQGIKNLKLSIVGFTTGSENYTLVPRTGRIENLLIPLYKDFDEPYEACKERLGSLATIGSTPLGDAYAIGMERLLSRKEPRRLLWIVTDGDPAIAVSDHNHNEYLLCERVYKRCKEQKIKIVLFNIGNINSDMKQYADVVKEVSLHTLATTMLEMVREIAA